MLTPQKSRGFTLLELMIGIVISLVVIAGAVNVFLLTGTNSSGIMLNARLANEMSSSINLIVDDIRRAGYWGEVTPGNLNNPFTQDATDINVLEGGNCILYTYDRNANGIVDSTEYFGFKMLRGAIEMRLSGATTLDCSDGTWEPISDSDITNIITLTFSDSDYECINTITSENWPSRCNDTGAINYTKPSTGDVMIEIRQIEVLLAGTLVSDSFVSKTYREAVKIRNDRFFEAP